MLFSCSRTIWIEPEMLGLQAGCERFPLFSSEQANLLVSWILTENTRLFGYSNTSSQERQWSLVLFPGVIVDCGNQVQPEEQSSDALDVPMMTFSEAVMWVREWSALKVGSTIYLLGCQPRWNQREERKNWLAQASCPLLHELSSSACSHYSMVHYLHGPINNRASWSWMQPFGYKSDKYLLPLSCSLRHLSQWWKVD